MRAVASEAGVVIVLIEDVRAGTVRVHASSKEVDAVAGRQRKVQKAASGAPHAEPPKGDGASLHHGFGVELATEGCGNASTAPMLKMPATSCLKLHRNIDPFAHDGPFHLFRHALASTHVVERVGPHDGVVVWAVEQLCPRIPASKGMARVDDGTTVVPRQLSASRALGERCEALNDLRPTP
eukprot:5628095-Prymnesium_polylepis.3